MRRVAVCFLSLLLIVAIAQAFRGGIQGIVTGPSGAPLAAAAVEAVHQLTGISYEMQSSSSGEFAFHNLPLGDYTISVSQDGFSPVRIGGVSVSAGSTYNLPVRIGVTSANTVRNRR
jgi:Carboxypeptidase regulatory-like domain